MNLRTDGALMLTTPPGYEAWSATDKHAWLWDTLVTGTQHEPETLPPLRLPFQTAPVDELRVVLRKRQLDVALSHTDDVLTPGRPKVIHARGSVAMVELRTDPSSPFTGLLGPPPDGGAVGLVRLSLVARVTGKAAFTPGMGLKLLRDALPSADVLAMNHTVGQGRDFDLFSNTMTNDLTHEHRQLRRPQRAMSVLFDRVSRRPRRLVSTHLTSHRSDGTPTRPTVTPDRLVFRPTDVARQVFDGQHGVDFRLVLGEVPPGTDLYDVVGVTPDGEQPVGRLRTTTTFRSSDGGDRLAFRHVQDPADRRLR